MRYGHRSAGKQRLLLTRTGFLPVLDIDRQDDCEARAIREAQGLAVGQRHILVRRLRFFVAHVYIQSAMGQTSGGNLSVNAKMNLDSPVKDSDIDFQCAARTIAATMALEQYS